MASPKPILVTGSHRSGTTWIGKMLSTSPSVGYIQEPFNLDDSQKFCGRCAAKIDYWYTYVTDENEANFYLPIKNTLSFQYNLIEQMKANTTFMDYAITLKEYLDFLKFRINKVIPLVKDPLAFFSAEWLAGRFDMKVVIIIRHPAAFASSLKRLHWTYDFSHFLNQPLLMRDYLDPFHDEIISFCKEDRDIIEQAILLWNIIYSTLIKYQEKHPDWIYLRYEDIANEPLANFKSLFEELNLTFSESVASTIKSYSGNSNPAEAPKSSARFTQRNSKENIWSWKNRLSEADIERIRDGVAKVSNEFYSDEEW